MKKTIGLLAGIILFFLFSQPALAIETAGSSTTLTISSSASLKNEIRPIDTRAEVLRAFLTEYNSPLVDYAESFINSADKYQLDWKLVPSITGVESTFGKQIPYNSYNAYGWANGAYSFESWDQSIDHVSRVLKEKYIDRGLDNPWKIGPVYAPPSSTWAGKVVFFMNKIENFDNENSPADFDLTI